MLIGACLDNVDHPSDASYARLRAMGAQVVGTLWTAGTHHRREVYARLEETLGSPEYHIRVGAGRMSPAQWAHDAEDAITQVPPGALGRVRVRVLNEVNLPEEGGWVPEEYAAFLMDACERFDASGSLPKIAAPLSLGDPAWRAFYDRMTLHWQAHYGTSIPTEGIGINAYAHLVAEGLTIADDARRVGKLAHVTEINTLEIAPGPERAGWLCERLRILEDAGVHSVEIFIVGGRSNGAWDERYILTDEEARLVGEYARQVVRP